MIEGLENLTPSELTAGLEPDRQPQPVETLTDVAKHLENQLRQFTTWAQRKDRDKAVFSAAVRIAKHHRNGRPVYIDDQIFDHLQPVAELAGVDFATAVNTIRKGIYSGRKYPIEIPGSDNKTAPPDYYRHIMAALTGNRQALIALIRAAANGQSEPIIQQIRG